MIPYDRPRGATHSLEHLRALSVDRCNILLVSDRTLYLLHNYAALDCSFSARYIAEADLEHYTPVTESDVVNWELYQAVVLNFQLEVLPMTCDIEAGLQAIADAIANQSFGGGGGGCGGGMLPCVNDLSNDELLPPEDTEYKEPYVGDPPEGFATWQEYFVYKCQAAEFIWQLERKYMVALRSFDLVSLTAAIVGPVVAGLLEILPAAMTPAGFVVFVASVVAIGVAAAGAFFYMDEMIQWWDDHHDEIICALYTSGTSPQAVSALANALEDGIQAIVAWGALEPISDLVGGLLGDAFAQLAGNGIVEPLFKAVAAVLAIEADCSACDTMCRHPVAHVYWPQTPGTGYLDPLTDEALMLGPADGNFCHWNYVWVSGNGWSGNYHVFDMGAHLTCGPNGTVQVLAKAPFTPGFAYDVWDTQAHIDVSDTTDDPTDPGGWHNVDTNVWSGTDGTAIWRGTENNAAGETFRWIRLWGDSNFEGEQVDKDGGIDAVRVCGVEV